MPDGDQGNGNGTSVDLANVSAGATDTSADGFNKEKIVALSKLLGNLLGGIKQLKEFSLSKEELEEVGIASSFQDLPCTFDIRLTREADTDVETTRIRRELKHILISSRVQGGEACSGEKCLTYVDVGIEHCVKPSKKVSTFWKVVRWTLVAAVALAAVAGTVVFVNNFSSSTQNMEISHSVFRLQNGTTNLTQKAVLNIQGEVKRK